MIALKIFMYYKNRAQGTNLYYMYIKPIKSGLILKLPQWCGIVLESDLFPNLYIIIRFGEAYDSK